MVSIDFLTVSTATFRALYVLVVLAHDRRRVASFYTPGLEISSLPEQVASALEVYANYFMLHGAVHRNLYHAGQIALLRSWSADVARTSINEKEHCCNVHI